MGHVRKLDASSADTGHPGPASARFSTNVGPRTSDNLLVGMGAGLSCRLDLRDRKEEAAEQAWR